MLRYVVDTPAEKGKGMASSSKPEPHYTKMKRFTSLEAEKDDQLLKE
jgi:hypothetical protein